MAGNLTNPWEILDRLLNRESGHRSLDIGRPDSSHCRHWLRCLQACSGPLEANGHRAQPVDDRPASGECLPDTALSARIPCPRLLSSMPTTILGEPADQKQHQGYCEQGPHNAAASFCWRIPQPCLDRTKPPPRPLPELGPMHGEGDAVGQHHREPGLRGDAKAIRVLSLTLSHPVNLTKIRRGNACTFSDFVTGQWACCRRVAWGLVDNVPVAHRVHRPELCMWTSSLMPTYPQPYKANSEAQIISPSNTFHR